MRYSSKMKIGSYIALVITVILFFCGLVEFMLHFQEATPHIASSWFLFVFTIIAAVTGAAFFESSTKNFIKKSEKFRSKMNYCYSCGFSLDNTNNTKICPKCNSKLNLLEAIDE